MQRQTLSSQVLFTSLLLALFCSQSASRIFNYYRDYTKYELIEYEQSTK